MERTRPGEAVAIGSTDSRGARTARAALAVAIVLGSQALWLLIPAATLWLLGGLLGSTEWVTLTALLAIPAALIAFACLLGIANRRYLRLAGRSAGHGPLEAVLPATIVLALVAASVWFIFFASHLPSGQEQLIP